jgi:hypothetical protein
VALPLDFCSALLPRYSFEPPPILSRGDIRGRVIEL